MLIACTYQCGWSPSLPSSTLAVKYAVPVAGSTTGRGGDTDVRDEVAAPDVRGGPLRARRRASTGSHPSPGRARRPCPSRSPPAGRPWRRRAGRRPARRASSAKSWPKSGAEASDGVRPASFGVPPVRRLSTDTVVTSAAPPARRRTSPAPASAARTTPLSSRPGGEGRKTRGRLRHCRGPSDQRHRTMTLADCGDEPTIGVLFRHTVLVRSRRERRRSPRQCAFLRTSVGRGRGDRAGGSASTRPSSDPSIGVRPRESSRPIRRGRRPAGRAEDQPGDAEPDDLTGEEQRELDDEAQQVGARPAPPSLRG